MDTFLSSYTTTTFASGKENSRANFLSSKGNANMHTHTHTRDFQIKDSIYLHEVSFLFI